ncbi:uncharacterized protein LOC101452413 [Ceratitis capitata]|uniref:(Mediterranean fruit fly) hypothetical protein n=2 Tax=Ceratitis capitata TaxID=7213 RepID=A0A811UBZ7_CERCA|nr:uncharacterized protein LOC101452413 [Ceratitis capitata]CAD6995858.1 unnamed protein product [Ceratitis capitata]
MCTKNMFNFVFLLAAIATTIISAIEMNVDQKALTPEKSLARRSLSGFDGDAGHTVAISANPWLSSGSGGHFGGGFGALAVSSWNPWNSFATRHNSAPSPSEVANAIASAKQASANVLIAQQQMQAAKENVLNQQRLAMEKETAAAILTQKSEAAAAIQRSEAAAAAQTVVLAQQRLAASKSAVAHQQRIAAAREAEAAAALQRSAHAAAAEIQKTEYEASKLGQYTRNGNAGAAHHLTLTKDVAFSPITAGTNHVPNAEAVGPWSGSGGKGAAAGGAGWL